MNIPSPNPKPRLPSKPTGNHPPATQPTTVGFLQQKNRRSRSHADTQAYISNFGGNFAQFTYHPVLALNLERRLFHFKRITSVSTISPVAVSFRQAVNSSMIKGIILYLSVNSPLLHKKKSCGVGGLDCSIIAISGRRQYRCLWKERYYLLRR